MIDATLLRFITVGAGNTALGLAVIFTARQFVSDVIANLLSYLVVVPVSFTAHRKLSFRDGGSFLASFLRYVPTIITGYAANYIALRTGLAVLKK